MPLTVRAGSACQNLYEKKNDHDWKTKQKTQTNKQKQKFDIDWNFW